MEKQKTILTHSARETFNVCPRKYYNRQIRCIATKSPSPSLAFGSDMHKVLEYYFNMLLQDKTHEQALNNTNTYIMQVLSRYLDNDQLITLKAIVKNYSETYRNDRFKIVSVEEKFVVDIKNPNMYYNKKGQKKVKRPRIHPTYIQSGKKDLVVEIDNELWIVDHKTASRFDDDMIEKIRVDHQVLTYLHYHNENNDKKAVGFIYDVIVKPNIKRNYGETDEEYISRSTPYTRSDGTVYFKTTKKEPETDEEYEKRINESMTKTGKLRRIFVRIVDNETFSLIPDEDKKNFIKESQFKEFAYDEWNFTKKLDFAMDNDMWTKHANACYSYNSRCEYFDMCHDLPYDENNFKNISKNPELAEEEGSIQV